MSGFPWHRIFHPLCGADPLTLLRLVALHGPPTPKGMPAYGVALATSLLRLPFTALDLALAAARPAHVVPPVFILGFPRSGTTHLHNLMAASGAFATAPPVLAASHREQVRELARTRRLAQGLEAAIESRDSEGAARLLLTFRRARRPEGPSKLARRSLATYGERRREVLRAAGEVARQRLVLERTLENE